MQTIDEVREHCRFVGKGIEKMVADSDDLLRAGGVFCQVLKCLKGLL